MLWPSVTAPRHWPKCLRRSDSIRPIVPHAGQFAAQRFARAAALVDDNVRRWNECYCTLEAGLRGKPGVRVVERVQHEAYGGRFQFHTVGIDGAGIVTFIDAHGTWC